MKEIRNLVVGLVLAYSIALSVSVNAQESNGREVPLEVDLARQIALLDQAKVLTALLEELKELPPAVVPTLFAHGLSADEKIRAALGAYQTWQQQQQALAVELNRDPDDVNNNGPLVRSYLPPPKLIPAHVVYYEVPSGASGGMVMVSWQGEIYSAAVGGSFKIFGKKYIVEKMEYVRKSEVELTIKTNEGLNVLILDRI